MTKSTSLPTRSTRGDPSEFNPFSLLSLAAIPPSPTQGMDRTMTALHSWKGRKEPGEVEEKRSDHHLCLALVPSLRSFCSEGEWEGWGEC